MEIEITETTIKKVAIELPYYCKSTGGVHWYKVYSKDEALQVCKMSPSLTGYQIQNVSSGVAFSNGYIEITKEEFEKEFNFVLNYLESFL